MCGSALASSCRGIHNINHPRMDNTWLSKHDHSVQSSEGTTTIVGTAVVASTSFQAILVERCRSRCLFSRRHLLFKCAAALRSYPATARTWELHKSLACWMQHTTPTAAFVSPALPLLASCKTMRRWHFVDALLLYNSSSWDATIEPAPTEMPDLHSNHTINQYSSK